MGIYPAPPSLLTFVTQPLMAGVIAGGCFLFVAIILSVVTACVMNHRRQQRLRKRRDGKGNSLTYKNWLWCGCRCLFHPLSVKVIKNFKCDFCLIGINTCRRTGPLQIAFDFFIQYAYLHFVRQPRKEKKTTTLK